MTTANTLLNHPDRLAALRAAGVLDTPPEQAFDRLTSLAASVLRAPVALVSFVDADRQFFKSGVGLPERWAADRESPLAYSLCQHVVESAAPLAVDDARRDARLRNSPAVREVGIVAYAGVPIAAADGHVLGSLCAMDFVPRAWTPEDLAALAHLAESAVTEITLRTELGERRRAEVALAANEAKYRGLLQRLPYIVYENEPEPPYAPLYASPAIAALGYGELAWRDCADFWMRILHEDDCARVMGETARARSEGAPVDYEYRVYAADGSVRWLHDRGQMVRDDDGRALVWQGVMVDITPRKSLEAELTRQASHDGLTGLANRTRLRARMERALTVAAPGSTPAVLLIDLDDFKRVNDSLGHAAGDRLLEMVADRLLGATRGSDTVARLGGDEFAVLLSVRRSSEVTLVADRIVAALTTAFLVDGREIRVGASVGVATAVGGETPDDLLRNADLALYRAKGTGKGRHAIFAPEMHRAAVTRLALEAELRWAISNGELRLQYQPIVDLATGAVAAAEALVRWQHPDRGMLPPGEFIPLAEATELVVPLGRWVLHTACRAAAAWPAGRGDAADAGGVPVSVNVSVRQLQRAGFVEDVAEALRGSGLPARRLTLEVTESVLLADLDTALMRLEALRALGVRVALDDFGTGYSSLAYLQRLPVDVLKIDRAFTADVTAGGKRAALARAVVTLADTLGLRTVAEGVETAEQHAELRALGCGFAQGYLYARPLDLDAFEEFLAADGRASAAPRATGRRRSRWCPTPGRGPRAGPDPRAGRRADGRGGRRARGRAGPHDRARRRGRGAGAGGRATRARGRRLRGRGGVGRRRGAAHAGVARGAGRPRPHRRHDARAERARPRRRPRLVRAAAARAAHVGLRRRRDRRAGGARRRRRRPAPAREAVHARAAARRRPRRARRVGGGLTAAPHASARPPGGARRSVTVNADPSPGALRTRRSPPMPRTRSRLIASPSPVPSLVRVSPVLTCTNGSNTASCLSRGMPMPVSCTRR
jgi:diguanylate cyclase (GGDEF)-like protein/PAS domain S-box-containing protein